MLAFPKICEVVKLFPERLKSPPGPRLASNTHNAISGEGVGVIGHA